MSTKINYVMEESVSGLDIQNTDYSCCWNNYYYRIVLCAIHDSLLTLYKSYMLKSPQLTVFTGAFISRKNA